MMLSFRSFTLLTISVTLVFSLGCQQKAELEPGQPILSQPKQIITVEMPHEALPHWRTNANKKPVLILLSNDSMLQPIPAKVQQHVQQLAQSGTASDFEKHGLFRADTLILPGQAVTAALSAHLFSKVIWVLPQQRPEESIDVDATGQSLFSAGAIDDYELQSFKKNSLGVTARIDDTPFEIVLASQLPNIQLTEPAIVHIDLTFFTSQYDNEIKTPIFPLIAKGLDQLKQSSINQIAVTLSLDSIIGQTPLDLRFLGDIIDSFFAEPDLLTKKAPKYWEILSRARYLNTFFQPEKLMALYGELLAIEPSPATHYALYQAYKLDKQMDKALSTLELAVQTDKVYGYEYMLMAADAYRRGDLPATVSLYRKATELFPDNPTIKLNLLKALAEAGRNNETETIAKGLRDLNWSDIYYPDIEAYINSFLPAK